MLTIHVWPKWLKRFLLTHPLYKSPNTVDVASEIPHLGEGRAPSRPSVVYKPPAEV